MGDVMERRRFLKLTFGFIGGATVLAADAEAAPLPPVTPEGLAPRRGEAEPAIASQDDVDGLAPEQVRWRRRFWGHRRRHWRRRYWGWPRFRWPFPRFWRRRYWW
jgi:hypothetical protein